jgi:hypothetical protein
MRLRALPIFLAVREADSGRSERRHEGRRRHDRGERSARRAGAIMQRGILILATSALAALGSAAPAAPPPITERNVLFLDYPGFPAAHSSWGSIGYSARHNKVFVSTTDHRERVALYEYDVATGTLRMLGFLAELANLRDREWQGKIHSYIVEGPDGRMYFGTDGGNARQGRLMDHPHGYGGGFFFAWDPATGTLANLGKGLRYESLKNIAVDSVSGRIYGITFPQAHLLIYDPRADELRDLGRLMSFHVPRCLLTDWWGNAYYVDWRQRLVKYERESDQLLFARESLPVFPGTPGWFLNTGLTAYAADEENGVIYLTTYSSKVLAFRPTREGIGPVEDLGGVYDGTNPPWDYWCRNLSLGRNGKLYYYVGGHGRYTEHGNKVLMMELDPKTRRKRLLMTFPLDVLLDVPGRGVRDREGNIYHDARRLAPGAALRGGSGASVPQLMIFNPERPLR